MVGEPPPGITAQIVELNITTLVGGADPGIDGGKKEFIRLCGMTHVRTSPFYPPSNGEIERWHKSLKGECLRPGVPNSAEEARRLLTG